MTPNHSKTLQSNYTSAASSPISILAACPLIQVSLECQSCCVGLLLPRCREGFKDVREARMLALIWVSGGIFYPSWSIKKAKSLFPGPCFPSGGWDKVLSFSLFFLNVNDIKASSKILLPHYIAVYNIN